MPVKVMKDKKNLVLLAILTVILLVLFFVTFTHIQTTPTTNQTIKSLIYIKSGGVKGVYNILEIRRPNEAIYTCVFSPRFGNISFTLSVNEEKVNSLFEMIIENRILDYNNKIYKARRVYDYFTYEIFSELEDGETIRVRWVDEWSSEEPLPQNIINIKEILENFIRQNTIPCE